MKRKAIFGFWTWDWETNWCCNETSPKTWVYLICINNRLPKQSTTTKIKPKTFFFHFCWTTFFFIFYHNPFQTKTDPPFQIETKAKSLHKKRNFNIHFNFVPLRSWRSNQIHSNPIIKFQKLINPIA